MYLHHLRFRRPQRDLDYIHKATWAAAEARCLWAMPTPTYLILMSPSDQVTPGREFAEHDVKPYDLTFDAGQRVTFSLIAHPTVAVKVEGRARSQRRALPPEEYDGWLRRKVAGALDIAELEATKLGPRVARRPDARATHVAAMFTGVGTVTDPSALRDLILAGIGTGKAHGGGLLIVGAA